MNTTWVKSAALRMPCLEFGTVSHAPQLSSKQKQQANSCWPCRSMAPGVSWHTEPQLPGVRRTRQDPGNEGSTPSCDLDYWSITFSPLTSWVGNSFIWQHFIRLVQNFPSVREDIEWTVLTCEGVTCLTWKFGQCNFITTCLLPWHCRLQLCPKSEHQNYSCVCTRQITDWPHVQILRNFPVVIPIWKW